MGRILQELMISEVRESPKKHDRALVVIDKDGHQSTLIIPPALLVADMHACCLALLVGDRILLLLLLSNVVALGKKNIYSLQTEN